MTEPRNPFDVLGLPVTASDEDVARQYNKLCLARPDDEQILRQAFEELRTSREGRRAHEVLEMPDTDYQGREDAWRAFERANRKAPVDYAGLAAETAGTSAAHSDAAPLITAALTLMLRPPDVDYTCLAAYLAALPGGATPPIGLADVIFG